MYFITNRELEQQGEFLDFTTSNKLSQDLKFCRLHKKGKVEEIFSEPLMQKLKDDKIKTEIFFYIHGFNNQPYDHIFPRAKAIQKQLKNAGLSHILVVPVIWPCDNDFGVIKDYWDDQESAMHSGMFFSRVISKFVQWQEKNSDDPCMKRMHLIAHSMGARVLMYAMHDWATKRGGVPYMFKNIFLMASDIPNESLEKNEMGFHITQAAQRVISYYANDDFAMPASKIANTKNAIFSRRIGHTGPEDMNKVPANVYAVNCDSFNNFFDKKGHSYFTDKGKTKNPAFQHIVSCINEKRVRLPEREAELEFDR